MKLKPKMASSTKRGLFALVLGLVCVASGIFLYLTVKDSIGAVPVQYLLVNVKQGQIITEQDLVTVEHSKFNLPNNYIRYESEVIGKYALRDMFQNEPIMSTSISDNYLKRLSEKAIFGITAVPMSTLNSAGGDIKENDFVKIILSMPNKGDGAYTEDENQIYSSLPQASNSLIIHNELSAVRVIGLVDAKVDDAGLASKKVMEDGQVKWVAPQMLIVDATPEQQVLLNQARDSSDIRIIILPEPIQEQFRVAWGLSTTKASESKEDALSTDNIKEKQEKILVNHQELKGGVKTHVTENVPESNESKEEQNNTNTSQQDEQNKDNKENKNNKE